MGVNLKSLIGKLNGPTRSALESAAGLCLSRTHYDIEVEHYLMKLMEAADTDLSRIFYRFEINQSKLSAELTRSLDKLTSGNARTPSIRWIAIRMVLPIIWMRWVDSSSISRSWCVSQRMVCG